MWWKDLLSKNGSLNIWVMKDSWGTCAFQILGDTPEKVKSFSPKYKFVKDNPSLSEYVKNNFKRKNYEIERIIRGQIENKKVYFIEYFDGKKDEECYPIRFIIDARFFDLIQSKYPNSHLVVKHIKGKTGKNRNKEIPVLIMKGYRQYNGIIMPLDIMASKFRSELKDAN